VELHNSVTEVRFPVCIAATIFHFRRVCS
jgi:hypothetical protein